MTNDGQLDRLQVKKLLTRGAEILQIQLNGDAGEHLARYLQELVKWNRRMNLIARNTPINDIVDKHFLDSLSLVGFIERQDTKKNILTDVGSGAGFPGLVIAVVRPSWQVRLVEPRQKRIIFLKHIVRSLELDNVKICAGRIEDEKNHPPGYSAYISGRAVAEPNTFLTMVQHLLIGDAGVILMTSATLRTKQLGCPEQGEYQIYEQQRFKLPFSGSQRCLSLVGITQTNQ